MADYDAIVIGSGMGGLASAALLAKLGGSKVLVLERHWRLGGFTHAFHRPAGEGRKYEWDVGLHYVGDLHGEGGTRKLYDSLTEGRLAWERLPAPFDRFVYPDLIVDVPDDVDVFQAALADRFPAEREGLARFFALRRRAASELGALIAAKHVGRLAGRAALPLVRHALRTTREVLADTIRDPRLAAVLVSQWGDYGVPPAESAFGVQAAVSGHYDHGGWYPVGGGGAIADAIAPVIERAGGELRTNVRVREILVEDGRAIGVVAEEGSGRRARTVTITAKRVLSNAGAAKTYGELLPPELVPSTIREDLAAMPPPCSVATLYLGLRRPASEVGLSGGNVWLFDDYDHDAPIEPLRGRRGVCYLSFPAARNPRAEAPTAEIIMPLDYASVAAWRQASWRRRGADYEALKERLAERMLERVEAHAPGFRELVAYRELSTPITVEGFTGHDRGAIYGLPATPARFRLPWLSARTPIRGLFLTGADVGLHGIAGAAMGGVLAAGVALGGLGLVKAALGDALPIPPALARD